MEVLPQILPAEDAEIAALARKSFEKQGIKILTNAKLTKLDKKSDSVTATIEEGGRITDHHDRARLFRRSVWSAISKISDWRSLASKPNAA